MLGVVVRDLVREWADLSPLCSGCGVEGRAKVLSLGDELRAQGSSLVSVASKPLGSHPPDLQALKHRAGGLATTWGWSCGGGSWGRGR